MVSIGQGKGPGRDSFIPFKEEDGAGIEDTRAGTGGRDAYVYDLEDSQRSSGSIFLHTVPLTRGSGKGL